MDTPTVTDFVTPERLATLAAQFPAPAEATRIPLDLIDTSGNYRKTFDPAKLAELAKSIRRVGVQHTVIVRPSPTAPGRFEMVEGERRLRASRMVGVELEEIGPAPTDIPAQVRQLTDAAVREIRLIAHAHREDVPPLEEAAAYQEMIELDGLTQADIAAKTDQSPGSVRAKLALLRLSAVPRKALESGRIVESVALGIALWVPAQFHEQATKECLGEGDFTAYQAVRVGEVDEHAGSGKPPRNAPQPLSVRQARAHLQAKYLLRLDVARFDTTDATLVPDAGACGPCPSRSGNQLELLGGAGRADLCTRQECYSSKNAAAYDRLAADAVRRGVKVLPDKDAARIFDAVGGNRIATTSPWIEPKDGLPYELEERLGGKRVTWAQLLGEAAAGVPAALVRDATGAPRELWDRDAAIKAAIKAGKLPAAPISRGPKLTGPTAGAGKKGKAKDVKVEREKAAREEAIRRRGVAIALGEVAEAAAAEPKTPAKAVAVARFVASTLVRQVSTAAQQIVATRRELGKGDPLKAIEKYIDGDRRVSAELRGLIVELLAAAGSEFGKDNLKEACALFDVDQVAAKRTAKEQIADEDKSAEAAKADKKSPPNLAAKKGKAAK